jgi:general secretion pathway protein M
MTAIVIASARPAGVFAWLDALAGTGVIVDTLTVTPVPDGSVAVNATLRRSGMMWSARRLRCRAARCRC